MKTGTTFEKDESFDLKEDASGTKEDEFYYDGTQHGKYPYSGTLDGATAYRIQFIYTDAATGREYLSDWYEFGSHYYYSPITNISQ